MASLPFEIWKYFIVGEHSGFSQFWFVIYIISCIFSSYIYAYLAAFGTNDEAFNHSYPGQSEMQFFTNLEISFETIFVLSIIKQFLTEYTPDGETQPIRDLQKIAKRYIKDDFVLDTICVLPISRMLKFMGEEARLFYLIKSVRIIKGINIFSVPKMMKGIKNLNSMNLDMLSKKNRDLGNDKNTDQIKINMLMMINYILRIIKLIIILCNLSFFFGIGWHIYCNLANKIVNHHLWMHAYDGE